MGVRLYFFAESVSSNDASLDDSCKEGLPSDPSRSVSLVECDGRRIGRSILVKSASEAKASTKGSIKLLLELELELLLLFFVLEDG